MLHSLKTHHHCEPARCTPTQHKDYFQIAGTWGATWFCNGLHILSSCLRHVSKNPILLHCDHLQKQEQDVESIHQPKSRVEDDDVKRCRPATLVCPILEPPFCNEPVTKCLSSAPSFLRVWCFFNQGRHHYYRVLAVTTWHSTTRNHHIAPTHNRGWYNRLILWNVIARLCQVTHWYSSQPCNKIQNFL